MVILGGGKAWKIRRHGDLAVSFQWVNNEPAMCLFNPNKSKSPAVAICLSAAHLYADSKTGAPSHYLVEKSLAYSDILGSSPRKIANVICDSMPDLVDMPPEPDWERIGADKRISIGEVTIHSGGQEVAGAEIDKDGNLH